MADAGFYCIGNNDEPDLVECFICGKQLNGWEREDDPWSVIYANFICIYSYWKSYFKTCLYIFLIYRNEHVKHKSDCLFVELNKQNETEWTVNELYNLYKKHKIKEYVSIFIYVNL